MNFKLKKFKNKKTDIMDDINNISFLIFAFPVIFLTICLVSYETIFVDHWLKVKWKKQKYIDKNANNIILNILFQKSNLSYPLVFRKILKYYVYERPVYDTIFSCFGRITCIIAHYFGDCKHINNLLEEAENFNLETVKNIIENMNEIDEIWLTKHVLIIEYIFVPTSISNTEKQIYRYINNELMEQKRKKFIIKFLN